VSRWLCKVTPGRCKYSNHCDDSLAGRSGWMTWAVWQWHTEPSLSWRWIPT